MRCFLRRDQQLIVRPCNIAVVCSLNICAPENGRQRNSHGLHRKRTPSKPPSEDEHGTEQQHQQEAPSPQHGAEQLAGEAAHTATIEQHAAAQQQQLQLLERQQQPSAPAGHSSGQRHAMQHEAESLPGHAHVQQLHEAAGLDAAPAARMARGVNRARLRRAHTLDAAAPARAAPIAQARWPARGVQNWSRQEKLQGWRMFAAEGLARTADGDVFVRVGGSSGSTRALAGLLKRHLLAERRCVLSAVGQTTMHALETVAELPGVLGTAAAGMQLRISVEGHPNPQPGRFGDSHVFNFLLELCEEGEGAVDDLAAGSSMGALPMPPAAAAAAAAAGAAASSAPPSEWSSSSHGDCSGHSSGGHSCSGHSGGGGHGQAWSSGSSDAGDVHAMLQWRAPPRVAAAVCCSHALPDLQGGSSGIQAWSQSGAHALGTSSSSAQHMQPALLQRVQQMPPPSPLAPGLVGPASELALPGADVFELADAIDAGVQDCTAVVMLLAYSKHAARALQAAILAARRLQSPLLRPQPGGAAAPALLLWPIKGSVQRPQGAKPGIHLYLFVH